MTVVLQPSYVNIVNFDNLTQIINNLSKAIQKLTPENFAPKYTDQVIFE